MATVSYRKNSISQLQNENGVMISDHEVKATLLWIAYRNKMRVSLNPETRFNLEQLIQVNFDFSSLILPISNEEVDRIVKLMPSDKAPGPDGFNGCFHKKCWPIIKQTFYDLCTKFYNDNLNLERINSSFVTWYQKSTILIQLMILGPFLF